MPPIAIISTAGQFMEITGKRSLIMSPLTLGNDCDIKQQIVTIFGVPGPLRVGIAADDSTGRLDVINLIS